MLNIQNFANSANGHEVPETPKTTSFVDPHREKDRSMLYGQNIILGKKSMSVLIGYFRAMDCRLSLKCQTKSRRELQEVKNNRTKFPTLHIQSYYKVL